VQQQILPLILDMLALSFPSFTGHPKLPSSFFSCDEVLLEYQVCCCVKSKT
jgi:hypothetical protein